jgi:hypothetical protein
VTKAQEKALKDKRRHDNIMKTLENPTTVPIVAGLITGGTITGLIAKYFPELLEKIDEAEISRRLNPFAIIKDAIEERSFTKQFEDALGQFDAGVQKK